MKRLLRRTRSASTPFLAAALLASAAAVVVTVFLVLSLGGPDGDDTGGTPTGKGGGNIVHIGPPLPTPKPKTASGIPIETDAEAPPGVETKTLDLPQSFGRLRILLPGMPFHEPIPLPPPSPGLSRVDANLREITIPEECEKADLYTRIEPPSALERGPACYVGVITWSDGRVTEYSYSQNYLGGGDATMRSLDIGRIRLAPGDFIDVNIPHGDAVISTQTVTEIRGVPLVIEQDTPGGQMYEIQFTMGDFAYGIGSVNVGIEELLALVDYVVTHDQGGS